MTPAQQSMGSRLRGPASYPFIYIFISAPFITKTGSILLGVLSPIFFFVWSFSEQIFPRGGGKEGCGRFVFNVLFTLFLAICQDNASSCAWFRFFWCSFAPSSCRRTCNRCPWSHKVTAMIETDAVSEAHAHSKFLPKHSFNTVLKYTVLKPL